MTKPTRSTGAIRAEIKAHEAAVRALESELIALEAASIPPRRDLATEEERNAYHRRRALMDDLAMMPPAGGVQLLVEQIDQIAALVVDDGMTIEAAIALVTTADVEHEEELIDDN